jgi:hypothetical protein
VFVFLPSNCILESHSQIIRHRYNQNWPGVVEGMQQFVAFGPVKEVYPFLVCESKLFLTNDKDAHELYYNALLGDAEISKFASPFSFNTKRGTTLYELNGMNYLKCASQSNVTTDRLREIWSSRVY